MLIRVTPSKRKKGIVFFNAILWLLGLGFVSSADQVTVWNQAYQETYERDQIPDIVANAQNAYVLLDPFEPGLNVNWGTLVRHLQNKGNEVAGYVSIGTGENWRADFSELKSSLVIRQWDDWAGEYFIDQPDENALNVMKNRINVLAAYGFDWVEFDNMDWAYDDRLRAKYKFSVTIWGSVLYYRELCQYAQGLGLKCMAKNTVDGAELFDGATFESYPDDKGWWNQRDARAYMNAGKKVIIIHYDEPNCRDVFTKYASYYGPGLSFLCETPSAGGYMRLGYAH